MYGWMVTGMCMEAGMYGEKVIGRRADKNIGKAAIGKRGEVAGIGEKAIGAKQHDTLSCCRFFKGRHFFKTIIIPIYRQPLCSFYKTLRGYSRRYAV